MFLAYLKRGFFYSALMAFLASLIFFYSHSSSWKAEGLVQNVTFCNGSGVEDETTLRLLVDSKSFVEGVNKRINSSELKGALTKNALENLNVDVIVSRNSSITRVRLIAKSRHDATELINAFCGEFISVQNSLNKNKQDLCTQNLDGIRSSSLIYAPTVYLTYKFSEVIKIFFVFFLAGLLLSYCLYFYKKN